MDKSFDRDSPTLNSHRHSHQWQPWKSLDLRRHQHRPRCAVSLPSALSLVASALASNSVSVISLSLSPRRLLVVYTPASSFCRSTAIFLLWPPLPSLSFMFGQNENGNGRKRREGRCFSVCVAVAPHSSTLNDFRSECFPLLILKKDDFVCSLSNGSCKLFELYGNETKMKLLAKELAPLQNIVLMDLNLPPDGHIRIMEWPSMNNILDEPRAHKSVRDMDFSFFFFFGGCFFHRKPVPESILVGYARRKNVQKAIIESILRTLFYSHQSIPIIKVFSVECEKARRYIPREFKLAEAFGNTLGGFFLASYEDSPAGVFDETMEASLESQSYLDVPATQMPNLACSF
ncbi:hypothetical protein Ahy_B05g076991 [Arachis hypogaea]|uniref:Uncharacterized protein n=1 Tax=Arachis hypogaea TaxID=3818 RepID=A0A444Z4B7_ARAHY|nr:hypothetical protein Ahy_B05g076991 [Arachis hypogaea]